MRWAGCGKHQNTHGFRAAKLLKDSAKNNFKFLFSQHAAAGAWQKGRGVAMSLNSNRGAATEPAAELFFPWPDWAAGKRGTTQQASSVESSRGQGSSWQGNRFPRRTLLIKTHRARSQRERLNTQISGYGETHCLWSLSYKDSPKQPGFASRHLQGDTHCIWIVRQCLTCVKSTFIPTSYYFQPYP